MSRNLIDKRIKITKKGKLLRRPSRISHNLAKKPSKVKRQKRQVVKVEKFKTDILKIYH